MAAGVHALYGAVPNVVALAEVLGLAEAIEAAVVTGDYRCVPSGHILF